MLLFISPKNEVDIWKVCKNALKKCIFTYFLHSQSNGKDPTIELATYCLMFIHV